MPRRGRTLPALAVMAPEPTVPGTAMHAVGGVEDCRCRYRLHGDGAPWQSWRRAATGTDRPSGIQKGVRARPVPFRMTGAPGRGSGRRREGPKRGAGARPCSRRERFAERRGGRRMPRPPHPACHGPRAGAADRGEQAMRSRPDRDRPAEPPRRGPPGWRVRACEALARGRRAVSALERPGSSPGRRPERQAG